MQSDTRKKLMYRSLHRGCKETDIILGAFAEEYLQTFNDAELIEFENLLEEADGDIFDWITGKRPIPPEANGAVMQKLMNYNVADVLKK